MPLSRQTSRIVWPSKPSTTRPSTSIRIRGVDCGRCGDWVVSRRSATVSAMRLEVGAGVRAGDQVSHLVSVGGARRHRDRATDTGRAGAAEDVLVELGSEVSHPAGVRKRRQPLVVAQGGGDDVGRQVGQELEVRRPRQAGRDPIADLADPARPDPARDRLAARLVGAEAGQEPGEVDDAGPLVGDDDRARADVGADGAEGVELVRRVEQVGRQHARPTARRRGRP